MKNKKKLKEKFHTAKNNKILLGYIFKFAPEMFLWKAFAILMILVSDFAFNIIFLKYVIDAMEQNQRFEIALFYIAGLAVIRVFCDFANACYNQYIEPVGRLKVHKGIYDLMYKKVCQIDLEKFDDTGFYNDYIWALNQVDDRTKNAFNAVFELLRSVLNVVMYTTVSFAYDKNVVIFIILPVIINVFVGMKRNKLHYDLVSELTPVNRKRDYSRRSFYLQQYAKEIRTYQIGEVLLDNFDDCVEQDIKITKKYRNSLTLIAYLSNHTGWMFSKILSAVYMCYQVLVARAYTVGVFVVIYQAIGTFTNSLISVFSIIPKFQENGLFAERIMKILNYESKIEVSDSEKTVPKEDANLKLQQVSFQYPHSKGYTLKKINLTINKGEKVALVGMNGAGKTTLVKLILRLYDPTEGQILLNNVDIRTYNTKSYRRKFSTIFQDYQLYAVKLIENIFMRKVATGEEEAADGYLHKSKLQNFGDRLWSNVTKEFDKEGIVFSGGQGQKVAIARALAKDGDILIMDEASSALDPISEYEINNTILEHSKDKSLIVISHRLSTVQNMDKIYFMEHGEIVEEGSHEELLKRNGKYAKMYNVQAEKYRKEKEEREAQ